MSNTNRSTRSCRRSQKSTKSQPKTCLFRGLEYRILWRHPRGYKKAVGGTCDPPWKKKREIEIAPDLSDKNKLRVMIDEGIHACLWDLDNDSVAQMSTSIADFLWQHGLRFPLLNK